ncbi:MAG: TfoX/Sxy family protein [Rhodothermaceae bacterium]
MKLSDLPNIGSVLESDLEEAGIKTIEDLITLGTEKSFKMIKKLSNPDACFSKLLAIEGAIQGIRWHGIDKKRKDELKNFINSLDD